jgi:putative Mg2+ transporter-C (MgtC) family protein
MIDTINAFIFPLRIESVATAFFCGFLIGLERQLRGKPAGIRTSILVCMATYLFIIIASTYTNDSSPSRVLGQVVSGIGFLGAGMILTQGGLIHGVTSAAVIWILAGIGALIGTGHHIAAIVSTFIVLVTLIGVSALERVFKSLRQGFHKKQAPQE